MEKHKKKLYLVVYNPNKKVEKMKKDKVISLTVNKKFGVIYFNRNALSALNMHKKWIQLSYDSGNKIIAWQLKNEITQQEMKMGWKLVRPNAKSGQYSISVKAILNTFIGLDKQSYQHLEVKEYKDLSLIGSDSCNFIEVK